MITAHIQFILLVTGTMTFVATIGFLLLPRHLLRWVFGVEETGLGLTLVIMLCGLAGSLIGASLVWAGFAPGLRGVAVTAAIIEKITFVGLVFLGPLKKFAVARWAAAGDSCMALLYVGYLIGF